VHAEKHLCRGPYRQPKMTGLEWVHEKLQDSTSCYYMFRMRPETFMHLHDRLVGSYRLRDSCKSCSKEALGMFLWMMGAPQSCRQSYDRFVQSLATVSKWFSKVLQSVLLLAGDIIAPEDPHFTEVHARLRNRRFHPYFNDCIGAIDGTHVPCVVPKGLYQQHLCRKGMTTQNVMVACDFNMRFTFVLSGWPGSVHDMRPFQDALTTHRSRFPLPPEGKYYLVDSGY